MIWLAWRQSRSTWIVLLAILGAVLGALFALHLLVANLIATTGIAHCLDAVPSVKCTPKAGAFLQDLGPIMTVPAWLNVLPAMAGIFVGAPMVAREIERGTFQLAWTQGGTRGRWFAAHLLVTLLLVTAVAVAVQAALWIVYQPILTAESVANESLIFQPAFFDVFGAAPIAYTLFSVTLGVASGAFLRRTIGAMLVVALIFVGVRVGVSVVRPHFMRPVTATNVSVSPRYPSWLDGALVVDLQQDGAVPSTCTHGSNGPGSLCGGPRYRVTYQPVSRFWPFQLIESGMYAVLSILLIAGSAMLVRWRRA